MDFRFDEKEHRYSLDDQEIPSVTQVLEPLQCWDGIPPETLEAARVFGQQVHHAVALALLVQLDWATLDPQLVPYVTAAQKFVKEAEVTVLRVEHRMVDPQLKFAGTLDLLGVMRRYTAVFDWKTPTVMPRTAGLQTAGYEHLFRRTYGGRPLKRYGVQLRADSEYRLYPYEDTRDWSWFVSALNLWWWQAST